MACISVIVPVFQVEPYLNQCLNAIREQTIQDIEIICSYTACTDGSFAILQNHAAQDKRIRIVRRDDGGLGGARNFGMQYASGEYVLFVDSDDWIEPDICEVLLELAKTNQADMVICPFVREDCTTGKPSEDGWGSVLPFPSKYEGGFFTWRDLPTGEVVWGNAPVVAWNKLYRREFLIKNRLLFLEECRYEDNAFYYQALVLAERISFTQRQLYHYRINRDGSLQDSSFMDLNTFDIVPALYCVKEFFIKQQMPADVIQAASEYILNEFAWRFHKMKGIQRKYLRVVRDRVSTEDYAKFLTLVRQNASKAERELLQRESDPLPKVSVVIPVYNCERYIDECIHSILGQTLEALEIICVNDASADRSSDIIRKIAKRDSRVKLLMQKENRGAGSCRNLGLQNAHGEFVFFIDGDDLLPSEDVLETMYHAALRNKVLAVSGNMECFDVDHPSIIYEYSGQHYDQECLMRYCEYTTHPTWGFTRFLYNYELILEYKIGFSKGRYYEDPCFLVSYMAKCGSFWCLPKSVYYYRVDPTHHVQLSPQKIVDLLEAMKIILPQMREISAEMYYTEYRTMVIFCRDMQQVVDRMRDTVLKSRIKRLANENFAGMDFSRCAGLLSEEEIFHSYKEFAEKKLRMFIPRTVKYRLWLFSRKHPPLYSLLHGINIAQRKLRHAIRWTGGRIWHTIRHTYAVGQRAVFRPVINGILFGRAGYLYETVITISEQIDQLRVQEELAEEERIWERSALEQLIEFSSVMDNRMNQLSAMMVTQSEQVSAGSGQLIDRLQILEEQLRFQQNVADGEDPATRKHAFLIGTPEHSNLGDAAITLGERKFINVFFQDYGIIELSTYDFKRWYHRIAARIRPEDIIFLQGGGNLGDRFICEEEVRRQVIRDFPENRIVILPQTIWFSDTEEGRRELETSREIYNRHPDLFLLTRGYDSLRMAQQFFPAVRCMASLDMALMLKVNHSCKRSGILLCLRDLNDESGLTPEQYEQVLQTVESFDSGFTQTNNWYHDRPEDDIFRDMRWEAVQEGLAKYASHEVVVTDRLHGMIFSVITHTPCVLLCAFNQKIPEFYGLVANSNAIFYIDKKIGCLKNAIRQALSVSETEYPEVTEESFQKVACWIKGEEIP